MEGEALRIIKALSLFDAEGYVRAIALLDNDDQEIFCVWLGAVRDNLLIIYNKIKLKTYITVIKHKRPSITWHRPTWFQMKETSGAKIQNFTEGGDALTSIEIKKFGLRKIKSKCWDN